MKKKSVHFTFFAVLFLATSFFSKAQYSKGDVEAVKDMTTRHVIIIKQEYDPKIIDALTKDKKENVIPQYKSAIDKYNENFLLAMDSVWPFKKEFVVKTHNEAKSMMYSKDPSYCAVRMQYKFVPPSGSSYVSSFSQITWPCWEISKLENNIDEAVKARFVKNYLFSFQAYEFRTDNESLLAEAMMPHYIPTLADFAFAIQYTTWQFKANLNGFKGNMILSSLKGKAAVLKDYTLYINEDDLSAGTTKETIAEVYPYSFKIVSDQEFTETILSKPTKSAYLYVDGNRDQVVMDCNTGDAITFIISLGTVANAYASSTRNGIITEGSFKTLLNRIE